MEQTGDEDEHAEGGRKGAYASQEEDDPICAARNQTLVRIYEY